MEETSSSVLKLPIGTLVLIDAQALYFSARTLYGRNKRTDFLKLQRFLKELVKDDPDQSWLDLRIFVVNYTVNSVEKDNTSFKRMLQGFGYSVVEKSVVEVAGPRQAAARADQQRNTWTEEIVAEAVAKKDRYGRFVFVAADGGVFGAVELLRSIGREVWVVGFPNSLNANLAKVADRAITIPEDAIWTVEIEREKALGRGDGRT
jgi:hypothetical protein